MDTLPTVPRGIRLNNPTNLRLSTNAWLGKIQSPDRDFEAFDTMTNGVRAAAKNAVGHWRRGAKSVSALVKLQAPASETEGAGNPTDAYIEFVAAAMASSPTVMLDLVDLRVLEKFVAALIAFECNRYPVPPETIRQGCAKALGLAP